MRETIGSHVETLTGLTVHKVNIVVVDAESAPLGQRVTRNDLLPELYANALAVPFIPADED